LKLRRYERGMQFIPEAPFASCVVECLLNGPTLLVEFQGTDAGVHHAEIEQGELRQFDVAELPNFAAGELVAFVIVRTRGHAATELAISTGRHAGVPDACERPDQ